jgi:DNA-binding HxlR family transcriptional regulator
MSTSAVVTGLRIVPSHIGAGRGALPRERCPLELALEALEGRQRPLMVWALFWGPRPFSELMRHVPGISKKELRRELVAMERLGLVCRQLRPGTSRRAEYSLSPLGETLRPLVGAMYEWGLLRLRLERKARLGAAAGGPAPLPPARDAVGAPVP